MPFVLTPERETEVTAILARYPNPQAACIPLLHLCQDQNGWIGDDVIEWVAKKVDLSPAHVKGVVTFYTLFNKEPVGEHTVWVCRTLSCALRGADDILHHCEQRLGIHVGETTPDGKITLRTAECLASCGTAPMMQVDKQYYENLTLREVTAILEKLRKGKLMVRLTNHLTKRYGMPEGWTLGVYEKTGGYEQAKRALGMTRDALVNEMKAANIRGRGGAGFPMGVKWSFMPWPPKPEKPHYLVINADEGEPGTFKDRTIMELDPHAVVEGCMIGCYGIGAHKAYVYVRDELHLSKARLWGAIEEAKKKGILGPKPFGFDYPLDVVVQTGAGAYICGEETALLNSLEGKRGEPRLKPPFPAQAGAFGMPTTVNNLETIAAVPLALAMGGENFSKLSDLHNLKDGGCRLYGVSGHVKKPGVFEACVGVTLRDLIYELGGGVEGGELLFVIPGGSSCPLIRPDDKVVAPDPKSVLHPWDGKYQLDVPMGVDTFRELKTMLGTCCAIVVSDQGCPVLSMHNLMRFYRHESCGQCTPCREGGAWIYRILERIVAGEGTIEELDRLHEIADNIMGNTICAFGEGTAMPALGFLKKFRKEFEEYIRTKGRSSTGRLTLKGKSGVPDALIKGRGEADA